MATGREGRESRLNERLRGAGRINVDDDDTFDLNIAGIATGPAAQSSSSPGSLPAAPQDPTIRTIDAASDAPYEEDIPSQPSGSGAGSGPRSSSIPQPGPSEGSIPATDEPEALRPPSSTVSAAVPRASRNITEEITESPAGKPGSGHRQRIAPVIISGGGNKGRTPDLSDEDDAQTQPSSPLANKTRTSDVARRPSMPAVPEDSDEEPEPEPEPEQQFRDRSRPQPQQRRVEVVEDEEPEESSASDEEAVGIDDRRAAQALGGKRPRPNTMRSPDLGSEESEDEEEEEPIQKRQRTSPAPQRQPAKRSKPQPKKKRHSSGSDRDDDAAIEITVQRFVNNFPQGADEEEDVQQEIPFANRGGETVVDVFAQVCEEVISTALEQFHDLVASSDDPEKKKEYRIKMRAVAAYREELTSRLLQHAIHLNHWHSLRRRLRHVQKEKLALRNEIIRLKGEREQVALRMDAIRIKHEADSKESTSRINASSLMHNIDLAVEQGREAPELSHKAEKEAELGNLDLILAQITDQVSSSSSTGGLLQQIQDFNAFLERAATALESG